MFSCDQHRLGRWSRSFELSCVGAVVARYHYQTRRDAERQFPHRVDIPVPELGLGGQLNEMHAWCETNVAAGEWAHASVTDRNRRDDRGIPMSFARFYFMDEMAAEAFRRRGT
jgi:hypothetical protein